MSGPLLGAIVPGLPHPLLCPERNEGWARLRAGFEAARAQIAAAKPDVLLVYSTMWPSIIGHQIQANPAPKWVHVDELFHDLGSMPYEFRMDAEFGEGLCRAAKRRGLQARTIAYHGFPIDTGSVVALSLLDPDNAIPASIVSSNVYADRAETIVFAKAARDALAQQGKTAAVVVVMTLSNRLFTDFIAPEEDRIHSLKDDEWNRKLLEFLGDGRLEDVAQLSREIHRQIRVRKVVNFKPMWWLSAVLGAHNQYDGKVHAYEALHGAGGAVVTLTPSASGIGDKEYDEEDVEVYRGDRNVIEGEAGPEAATAPARAPAGVTTTDAAPKPVGAVTVDAAPRPVGAVTVDAAPRPVGAYPHSRRVGELLFLSGIGPRTPGSDAIPGGPIRDANRRPLDYDVAAQTRQVIENVKTILAASGGTLEDVLDVTVFLVDMDRDFRAFNEVYREHFEGIGATRTTVDVDALPTPIAVEFKVIARAREGGVMDEIIDISPVVSERTAVWPGDVPFRRAVSLSIDRGDNIDLSSIQTSVHVGAHADAPSHFAKGGAAIGDRPLDLYYGPCQVVDADVGRGERIRPEHVTVEITEPRVLLRTGTFPDPEVFTTDFAALSPELVDFLAGRGVRLVGIDTPSVDLFGDRELVAHQAIARHDLANLECLALGHVTPGRYTLVAMPLRLAAADASPVRAALIRSRE